MKRRLILGILVFLLATSSCGPGGCGTLVKTCGDDEQIIMRDVKDLSQNVEGDIRYFTFWDCAMEEWIQSSCSANCILEIQ